MFLFLVVAKRWNNECFVSTSKLASLLHLYLDRKIEYKACVHFWKLNYPAQRKHDAVLFIIFVFTNVITSQIFRKLFSKNLLNLTWHRSSSRATSNSNAFFVSIIRCKNIRFLAIQTERANCSLNSKSTLLCKGLQYIILRIAFKL